MREQQSCSRKWAMSRTLQDGSPHDSSGSQGQELPTPPQPLRGKTSKEPEAQQRAFRDAIDLARSPSMSWEDWVQEEEEQERHSSMEGDPKPGLPPLPLESESISDVSMVDKGLLQCHSDVIIEEEREEGMEIDAPLDSAAPAPPEGKAMPEDLEAGDHEDCCSQMSEESTNQNLPHDSDPDEDKLLGPPTDVSVPRGHSDDSIALVISPGEDDL